MITPEKFLVERRILYSEDLNTPRNLKLTRDMHIHSVKEIVKALQDYADMAVQEFKDNLDPKE